MISPHPPLLVLSSFIPLPPSLLPSPSLPPPSLLLSLPPPSLLLSLPPSLPLPLSSCMTMPELLEKLIMQAKVEAREALRQLVAALNGVAGICILKGQVGHSNLNGGIHPNTSTHFR